MSVRFCNDEYEMGTSGLGRLRDSSDALADPAELHARLNHDGYLYIKGFFDRGTVEVARQTILEYMAEREGLEPGARPLDGVMGRHGKSVALLGRRPITHHPSVHAVLESPKLFAFFESLIGEPVKTFDYKWLRAVGNEEATGCHMDHVYMGRGSARVMTCWIPFMDIPVDQGTLAVCEGSNQLPSFEKLRNTYGRMDVDKDQIEGWFTKHPREITEAFGGRWLTDDIGQGDIITFGMHLMHASTTNTTDRWRISCDVRFQPASEPCDERWTRDYASGAARSGEVGTATEITPISEARKAWGI